MKRYSRIGIAILGVLAIAACQLPLAGSDATGTLVLSLSPGAELAGRTIAPTVVMEVNSYDVRGYGPDGAYFEYLGTNSSTVVETSVALGNWVISVDGFNPDGVRIATGTEDVVVGPGEVLSVTVTIVPVDGIGTVDISIEWPAGVLTTPTVESTITPAGGSPSAAAISLDSATTASLFDDTLDDGYYVLTLTLKDMGTVVWSTVESVRIIADQVASASFVLTEDVNAGGFEVAVEEDLGNPVAVTFNVGDSVSISVGGSITIVAVTDPVDPGDGSFSYAWYLAGSPLGETSNSVTVGDGISAGVYWLDLILTTATPNGSVLSSGRTKITVGIDGSATATAFSGDVIVISPPGGLPPGSTLGVQPLDPAAYHVDLGVVGGFAFAIDPANTDLGVDGQIVVRYNDTVLPSGIDEADLVIVQLQNDGSWLEIPSTVDAGAKTVSAFFASTGSYALATRAASVQMSSASISPIIGSQSTVTAQLFDAAGNVLADRSVVWSTDNAGIASIVSPTVIAANNRGTTYVRATSGAAQGVTEVIVHVWLYTYQVQITLWDPHVDFDGGTDEYRPVIEVWLNGVGNGSAFAWNGNATDAFGLSWWTGTVQSYSPTVQLRVRGSGYEEDSPGFPAYDDHDYFTVSDQTFTMSSGGFTAGNGQFTWHGILYRSQQAVP